MAPRWPWRLAWLVPVLPLVAVGAALFHQGSFLAERALRLTLGEGPLHYSLAPPGWDASLRLSDLRFGDTQGSGAWLRAERVEISGQSWWWLLRNSVRQARLEAPLDRLEVVFEQVEVRPGLDPALGELAPAGLSGAPFETLACPAEVRFDAEGLAEAELELDNRLGFTFRVEGQNLETLVSYRQQGSARIERRLEQSLAMPLSVLVIDQYPMRTRAEHWLFEDLGFSRIRHRRCAERGELIALVDRHVRAVQDAVQSMGLAASEEAWASYRRYVRDGGMLELSVRYPQPAPLDGWFDRPRPASLLALSQASLIREAQRSEFVPANAFTEGLGGDSPKLVARLPLQDTIWIDPEKALVLLEPGRAATPAAPAEAEAAAEAPNAPDPDPPTAAAEVVPQPPAEPVPRPAANPSSRSRLSNIPQPEAKIVVVGEQRSRRLDWNQLQGKVGARLRITTRTGSTRVAELVGWSASDITIRQRIGGGIAESRIQREMFRSAVEL
ncbi:hypothetical protein [Pseudomarimonas salicorniae]|uniref:Uncharacterized protein n=1 Tax=Pseudomarimonas salicorniae TaxID=2933270 RepID=A0ABT0GFQ8_9GAMM|nr:hypothetical protein [Lysobacter sp. CAU 1642]MCK7593373.1 hypothetical protein [Lysobacter sp. CAU 1642]